MENLKKILEARGHRHDWLAQQLGVSDSYLSRLLSGDRPWTPELRREASRVLMLPEELLFPSQPEPVESPAEESA